MKREVVSLLLVFVLLFSISFVSAVWWNPFTWGDDVRLSGNECDDGITDTITDVCNEAKGVCEYTTITGISCTPTGNECNALITDTSVTTRSNCNSANKCELIQEGKGCGANTATARRGSTVGTTRTYTCPGNQTIMNLSSTTNAHGALWNGASNSVGICYTEIFDVNYTGTTPHACITTGTTANANLVLAVGEKDYESHSKSVAGTGLVNVCYGDLVCNVKSTACDSDAGERLVASSSSITNGHLAADDSYDFNVCCTSAFAEGNAEECTPGDSGDAYCVSIHDENYVCNPATQRCRDERVPLCPLGQTLCSDNVCRISSECPSGDDNPITCNYDNVCGPILDADGLATLDTEGCECSDCWGYSDSCASDGAVVCAATDTACTAVVGTQLICDFQTSSCQPCPDGNGVYNTQTETCTLDPAPVIVILAPLVDKTKIRMGELFKFDQEITNEVLLLRNVNVSWHFPNEVPEVIAIKNCLTEGVDCDSEVTFEKNGYKNIKVVAVESSGEERSSTDYREVLVYDVGLNLFAIISSPNFREALDTSAPIRFNASTSFVAECFKSTATETAQVLCETEADISNIGLSCYEVLGDEGIDDDLYCYNYPNPYNALYGTDFPPYTFEFEWTFDSDELDGSGNSIPATTKTGSWDSNDDEIVSFEETFKSPPGTNHTVSLVVSYSYDGGVNA